MGIQFQTILTMLAMVLISVSVGAGGFLALREAGLRARRRSRLGSEGAEERGSRPEALSGVIDKLRQVGDRVAIQDPVRTSALRQQLMQAGFFNRDAVTYYLGARVVTLALGAVATLVILPVTHGKGMMGILLAAVFSIVALMGPERVIKARISSREREYRDGFPDLLDLLVASVEAGLSLDSSVSRITDELVRRYPHLAEHLKLLTLELRAGRSRKDVWMRLAERLGIDEAKSFATMLRQSEEMGTSLGDTLKVFSDEMRNKRMMRAEEKAMALPAKLTVPLILFIFPCLLGVLIMPAAYKISTMFSHH
ncbi:MAG TPA: type II secretion system F family protein [Caulobacteraceae bacterium]|jgi:tight adherence protein C|nr:type II secretion system F family protein [Caulobacteraceae bacterium]